MVNHSTKVYARLKKEKNGITQEAYEIVKKKSKFEDIIFTRNGSNSHVPCRFRFHKVFDQRSCQSDIFDAVAKPIINSVIEGFNGTIFAYGQTGSGKTYTITGSPKNYNDRGIIPRSLQYIFEQNEMVSEKPTVYVSYIEIYNEVGYDLLSPKQHNTARTLEELPRITIMEDKKGEAHIRNISVLPVTTEQEAMRLLFLGDTNRTIAETPMNEYSSRSHCIFTVYMTKRNTTTNRLRFSKLHLVDLAGSERVSKSQTTGVALHEAKYINLSLHFLQQVILALSESKRTHIPYRNSLMTIILKDSLSGNCLTSMLATLTATKNNIQETISTCKFAQRVSLITTEPIINELSDPQQEISFLKSKIEELKEQIASLTEIKENKEMTKEQKIRCQLEVEKYLQVLDENKELNVVQPDLKQVQFCFSLLKKDVILQKTKYEELKLKLDESNAKVQNLKEDVQKKTKEIESLKNIIDKIPENPVNLNKPERFNQISAEHLKNIYKQCENNTTACQPVDDTNHDLMKIFLLDPQNSETLNFYQRALQNKLEMAKLYAQTIDQCQTNISYIRQRLENCPSYTVQTHLINDLEQQQDIYREALNDLKNVQKETSHLEAGLKQAEIKTNSDFRRWLEKKCSETPKMYVHPDHNRGNCYSSPAPVRCTCFDRIGFPANKNQDTLSRVEQTKCSCSRANCCELQNVSERNSICACSGSRTFYCGEQNPLESSSTFCPFQVYRPIITASKICTCEKIDDSRFTSTNGNLSSEQDKICKSKSSCCPSVNFESNWYQNQFDQHASNGIGHISQDFQQASVPQEQFAATKEVNTYISSPIEVAGGHEFDTEDVGGNRIENNDDGNLIVTASSPSDFFEDADSVEFKEFMKTVSLTGDVEVDKEIFSFYRTKFY